MTISIDVQELIITAFLKNSHIFVICKDEITDGYFTSPALKVIYKALQTYYKKYNSSPNLNELIVAIEDCYYPQVGATLPDIKDTCNRLWNSQEPDETFILDKITDFIRKTRSAEALQNFLEQLKINPNLEEDVTVAELTKSLDIHLKSTKVYHMSDSDHMSEARKIAVGSFNQNRVIKSIIPSLNNSLMFGGYQPGTVNMIVCPPGTGKSMFLINEGMNAATQGFDVLHIFIGDMQVYDGEIRYLSRISGHTQNDLVTKTESVQADLIRVCNQQYGNIFSRINLVDYPSLSLTVTELFEEINRMEKLENKDYGMIIVDYPDNLLQDGVSLYTDGGVLYSTLEKMARLTKAVVLVASQPSKAYWSAPIIPLEGAAESSKKQQCVDIMLTFNTEYRGANFGTMFLAKARKGEAGQIYRIRTDFSRCFLEEINEGTYNAIKAADKQLKLTNNNSNTKGNQP